MNLSTLALPFAAVSICLSIFIPSGKTGYTNHWEDGKTYVYYTTESAVVFEGEEAGVGHFNVSGETFDAYLTDTELQDGDEVTLIFENRETREEYILAEEYGIESTTRVDNGQIVDIR